ncbi:uncharacterized protein LOC106870149 [Octopus bimaculoides]|uniref:Large ribosomal subunit protein mL53 n=1 Tax=Octopus bimaculoides TaxID=37653 RepID=A0A0L8HKC0_OCTBM|nr:uncharacterized protein LOC106870149 [Octopus bimaculoides]|eukprot:XP_014771636.1 PREDICTED: uncharacterized protein LOC106870149 [Octopus bimaculoides]
MAVTPVHVTKEVIKRLSKINLRPVKRIAFTFNPFVGDSTSLRECLFHLNSRKILGTNPKVTMKVDVKSNLCDPVMEINFNDDTITLYKTNNLTSLEIIDNLLQYLNSKDIVEENIVLTKKGKKQH